MKTKLVRTLMLVAALLPVVGSAAEKTFVMVPKGVHPYYEPCYEGFKAAAKKYGVKVDRVDPQKFDVTIQAKVIEDLIAQKVDGIAISANDDAGLVPVVADATKAGIKVITFDADAKSSARLEYIGTNNEAAGTAAGKKMAELMKGQGNLVILQGGLGASNLNERTAGFKRPSPAPRSSCSRSPTSRVTSRSPPTRPRRSSRPTSGAATASGGHRPQPTCCARRPPASPGWATPGARPTPG